ncbi:MAG: WYL domain-containing protein [Nocardioides sp.]
MARKTERLLNLLIMLLVQRHFVSREKIRSILYGDQSDEAFDKMFERDKEELRSLGVPIEVGHVDNYFEDEVGYRIRPDAMALPDIELTPQEAAVVGLAGRVWEHATLAEAASDAVRKLMAAGDPVDTEALDLVAPKVNAEEPAFEVLFQAAVERTPVEFEYARTGRAASTRHLQPWGVVRFSGRWYVVGWDVVRQAERIFRISRIVGPARLSGAAGSYDIPAGIDLQAVTRRLAPAAPETTVRVRARAGTCLPLRRAANASLEQAADDDDGWDDLTLPPGAWTAEEFLPYGADVVVLEPVTLRDQIRDRLAGVVAKAGLR